MLGDDRALAAEELGHLLLGQPNGLALQADADLSLTLVVLVDNQFAHGLLPSRWPTLLSLAANRLPETGLSLKATSRVVFSRCGVCRAARSCLSLNSSSLARRQLVLPGLKMVPRLNRERWLILEFPLEGALGEGVEKHINFSQRIMFTIMNLFNFEENICVLLL